MLIICRFLEHLNCSLKSTAYLNFTENSLANLHRSSNKKQSTRWSYWTLIYTVKEKYPRKLISSSNKKIPNH